MTFKVLADVNCGYRGPPARPPGQLSARDRPQASAPGSRGEPRLPAPSPRPVGRRRCWTSMLELDRQRRELLVQVGVAQGRAQRGERGSGPAEAGQGAGRRADGAAQGVGRGGQGARRQAARHRDRRSTSGRSPLPNFPADRDARRRRRGQPRRPHLGRAADVRLHAASRTGSWAPTLGILDLPAGAKITGSGFPLFRGAGRAAGAARSRASCSTSTPASTATRRSRRRTW